MTAAGWVLLGAPLDSSASGRGEVLGPGALRDAGLLEACSAVDGGDLPVELTDAVRDAETGIIAHRQVVAASGVIRSAVAAVVGSGRRPLVVGGDCTVLIGSLAGARTHVDALDLVFVDGQPDALDGERSPTGEAADMDLAIVTGHGPAALTDLAGARPIVEPTAVTVIGHRRGEPGSEAAAERALVPGGVVQVDATDLAARGAAAVGAAVSAQRHRPWWLHVDVDVFDERSVAAVTYPQPGGPDWDDARALLVALAGAPGLVGLSVADLRPDLDPDGDVTRRLVDLLAELVAAVPPPGRGRDR